MATYRINNNTHGILEHLLAQQPVNAFGLSSELELMVTYTLLMLMYVCSSQMMNFCTLSKIMIFL